MSGAMAGKGTAGLPELARPLLLIAAGAGVVALIDSQLSDYMVTLAAIILINVMLASSLALTNGLTGLFSLGHPAFMTIGGYVAAILAYPVQRKSFMMPELPEFLASTQLDFLPALLIGGAAAALAALVIGFPVLRLRGHYLAVATLGLIIIVRVLVNNWDGITRGGMGLSGVAKLTDLWWVYGWTVLTIYVCWRIKFSSVGRAMMAVRENEMAAKCMGISAVSVKMWGFVLGAFFAGVGGALMCHLITVITPGMYSVLLAFNLVVMVVIGGMGSLTGAILAAIAISALSESLRPAEEALELYGMSQVVVALCLILVLVFRPRGVFGSAEPGWARYMMGR